MYNIRSSLPTWVITVRLENGEEYSFPRELQDIEPEYIEAYMRNQGWDVIRVRKLEA